MAVWEKQDIVLTRLGEVALSKAEAGIGQIHITRAACSSDWKDPITNPLAEELSLDEVQDLKIIRKYTKEGSTSTCIDVQLNNENTLVGFTLNRVGVYATHEDVNEGQEFLYLLAQASFDAEKNVIMGDIIPPISKTPAIVNYSFCLMNFSSDQVTVNISPSGLITSQEMEEHINSLEPHPNTPTRKMDVVDVTKVTNVWCEVGNDGDLHRIGLNGMQVLMLGDNASTLKNLQSRIRQLEMESMNTKLKLEEKGMTSDGNLSYTETFTDEAKNVDTFSVKVLSIIAGDDTIDVETVEGVIAGAWYTITDGIAQESFRVKSCSRNGRKQRIVTESAIQNKYDLSSTSIYRSTVDINANTGVAYSSGNRRGVVYTPVNNRWAGVKGNSRTEMSIDMSYANRENFTYTSGITFTSDNLVTLKDTAIAGVAYGGNGHWQQYEGVQN